MEINLAVVFTEYQLLQVESVVSHFRLKNVQLLVHNKNNRISHWLINRSLFEEIIEIPIQQTSRSYKLSRQYLKHYSSVLSGILQGRKVNIFIGAQDENTIFAIIKHLGSPQYYWNIEDGSANYVRTGVRYKSQLFFKKLLFTLYGYGYLDIRYGHGLVRSDKKFRLYSKLSTDTMESISLGVIFRDYLRQKVEGLRQDLQWVDKYRKFDTLVVTELVFLPEDIDRSAPNELYKFHPEDRPQFENIVYIKENIPLEFLPFLLPDIKTVKYQTPSSSILIMLVLGLGIKIQLDYQPPNKALKYYTDNIIREFTDKIEVLQC